jgi:MFS family permease
MVWKRLPHMQVCKVHHDHKCTRANSITSCTLQLSTGKLYTHFNLKVPLVSDIFCPEADSSQYTFLTFLGIFELGSVLCGAAQSSTMLIIGRAVSGLGASGLMNGSLTILAAAAPVEKRPGTDSCLRVDRELIVLFSFPGYHDV